MRACVRVCVRACVCVRVCTCLCPCNAFKGTVHSKIKCGLIEGVLDTDSNEPSLASIRELEPSQKDDTRRHVIHIT